MKREVYIGTYNNDENSGIFRLELDTKTGEMSGLKQVSKVLNPNYMVMDKERNLIYSVLKDNDKGGVCISKITDSVTVPSSKIVSDGHLPCHVSIDKKKTFLFSANYRTGVVRVYSLGKDGELTGVSSETDHNNLGLGETHPHYTGLTPDEKYLFVVDLGLDMIILYNYSNGKLGEIFQKVLFKKGCGPRHIVFDNTGEYAYLITEYSTEIVTMKYSENEGLEITDYISALGKEFPNEGDGAAIRLSKDGTRLFSSSRKPGTVSMFEIDSKTKKPVFLDALASEGEHTRDINIDEDGNVLIAANRFSNNLVTFLVSEDGKKLVKSGYKLEIAEPTNIIF
jgi:6-phosphogluconolactonase